ncbi:MAG TPA: DEAD/DEAH box helicase, partial [Tianweitania sediminis]|nr:DEAD/DEAH box helicase [Tianweitania sediminis]
ATGAGKTKTAAAIVKRALAKGKRVVFTVPATELIDQTVKAFRREGIDGIGVMQGIHEMTDSTQPVQVATIQTLMRRKLPNTDLVIVDEAHVAYKGLFRWMQEQEKLPFIGLSATPWTKGLGKHFDELIVGATTRFLISTINPDTGRTYLSPFRVFAPSHPDLTGVKTVAGDYHEGQLAEAMDKPQLTADVVSTWLKLGEDRPTLCFAVNRAHARSLLIDFQRAGVACEYVDGNTDRNERKRVADAFASGYAKVVVNVGVLTTGVDWDVRCLILARPTKSEMLYVQIIGRGLRSAEGKDDCIILDHSDTTLSLGFVTDIHHDQLDDGKPRKASTSQRKERPAPKPKECPKCTYLKPAGIHACPSCGFAPQKVQDVSTAQGDLAHLGGKSVKATMEDKQRWFSMLSWYAWDRGYKPGWAANKYHDKFGVWPNSVDRTMIKPDVTVMNWIRSTQIKWIKGREKAKKQEAQNGALL